MSKTDIFETNGRKPHKELVAADVVIIDEISMCRIDLFDYLMNEITKANDIRNRDEKRLAKKEGRDPVNKDIQVVVTGDFYQLEPVLGKRERELFRKRYGTKLYAFEATAWKLANFNNLILREAVRTGDDLEFHEHLNLLRSLDDDEKLFEIVDWFDMNTKPDPFEENSAVSICGTNKSASSINEIRLSKIDSEMQNIDNRIMKINRVLSKAEFKQNSYLRITPQKAKESPVVEKFNRAVRKVGNMLTSSDHESRFASLNDLMDILNNAISHDKQFDNRQLLDPRLRREFVAEEIDRRNGQVRDVLKSSSGKSGGEKEAFAGAVVAASLAYVLTPDNSDVPSYCTVFLDEAFSNTSDRVSERVLRIFRELKLHINLITPFKNIDIARNYARSLIVMTRNDETNDSCAHELTWEEYEDQQNKRQEEQEKRLAAEFDIQVESGVEPENTPGV